MTAGKEDEEMSMPPSLDRKRLGRCQTEELIGILGHADRGLWSLARRYQDALLEYIDAGRSARIPWKLRLGYAAVQEAAGDVVAELLGRVSVECDDGVRDLYHGLLDAYREFHERGKGAGYQSLRGLLDHPSVRRRVGAVYDLLPNRSSRQLRAGRLHDEEMRGLALRTMQSLGFYAFGDCWLQPVDGLESRWFTIALSIRLTSPLDEITVARMDEHVSSTEANLGLVHGAATEGGRLNVPRWWLTVADGVRCSLSRIALSRAPAHPSAAGDTTAGLTDIPSGPGWISLSEAAEKYDVLLSDLSKAASRPKEDRNHLETVRVGRMRYVQESRLKPWFKDYAARREQRAAFRGVGRSKREVLGLLKRPCSR